MSPKSSLNAVQNKLSQTCLLILTSIALAFALAYVKPIAIPFVIAIFLYAVFLPISQYLQKKAKLPRSLAILASILGFLIFIAILFIFIINSIQDFAQNTQQYQETLINLLMQFKDYAESWSIQLKLENMQNYLNNVQMFDLIKSLSNALFVLLGNLLLIIVFVVFLFFGDQNVQNASKTWQDIQLKISKYTLAKFFISVGTALCQAILLTALRIEMILMFSVMTFLLNFIPNIGSMIAILLPLPIGLLQFGLGVKFYILVIGSLVVQTLWGNILEPKLMGDTLGLHPVTILLSLLFWGMIWGVAGMFLAVPLTSILKIVLEKIPSTQKIAKLLEGQLQW